MILEILPVGQLQANCYIIGDRETKEVAVIDPGDEGDKILNVILEKGYNIKYIIATHGHVDHISQIKHLKYKTKGKVVIHKKDAESLMNSHKNLSAFLGYDCIQDAADIELEGNEILDVGKYKLKIIHTPGHTLGGICILVEKLLFSGDTLFYKSVGRSDLPGGDHAQLIKSIQDKLFILDNDIQVYPGHGDKTSIGFEKENNPFF